MKLVSRMQLISCSDEELAVLAPASEEAESILLSRYLQRIRLYAGQFAQSPADAEDLAQEGMMALLHAIPKFCEERQVKFSTFARTCVMNRLKSLVRRKDVEFPLAEDELESLETCWNLADPETPETILFAKEQYHHCCMRVMAVLSKREWSILQIIMAGMSYQQTADLLGISLKSVDNAMQRVRRKMRAEESAGSFPF